MSVERNLWGFPRLSLLNETAEERWGVFDVCVVEVLKVLPYARCNNWRMLLAFEQF